MTLQLGLVVPSATAQGDPSPEPPASAPLEPTTISAPAFSGTGGAAVTGSRTPGSAVSVTADGRVVCSIPPAQSASWACTVTRLPTGAGQEIVATESPAAPTDPAPPAARTTIDVLLPPVLDGSGASLTPGLVSGTGNPGSFVRVVVAGTVDANCSRVPVSTRGTWSCSVSAEGGPFTVRAQQVDPAIGGGQASAFSNARNVTVDRTPPEPAVIVSPAAGARVGSEPLEIRGTGENGGTVDVYVDAVPVCSTTTSRSGWSCVIGGMAEGERSIVAIQRDAAGNFASPSAPLTLTVVGDAAASPGTPTPEPTPEGESPDPAEPSAPGSPSSEPETDDDPTPSPSDTAPPPGVDVLPPPADGSADWGSPTEFGSALTSITDRDSLGSWWVAPAFGVLFLALFAIPLRMLATTLRGRVPVRAASLTGRNRPRADHATTVNPWLAGAVPLGIAAVFIAVSSGVDNEVRYARLVLAIVIGLSVLNIVGGAVATRLGATMAKTSTRLRFMPIMLAAAVTTAILSRSVDLDPPIIAGVLIGASFVADTAVRRRAVVSLTQLGAVTVLGVLAWLGHGVVGTPTGFVSALVSESLATICLAGLGSALVLALPIGSLPGRVLLEWSAPVWALVMVVVAAAVATVVAIGAPAAALVPWLVAAAVFAALSAAVWTYTTFVAPAFAR
ncbi:hypothetical protein [Marisediminicola sp. LYQ134]|uniref:hypothetical protein n=1 Tax=Marisediminicola sp. LYQ134 TaxID=3391061 RepID=UPI003983648D